MCEEAFKDITRRGMYRTPISRSRVRESTTRPTRPPPPILKNVTVMDSFEIITIFDLGIDG